GTAGSEPVDDGGQSNGASAEESEPGGLFRIRVRAGQPAKGRRRRRRVVEENRGVWFTVMVEHGARANVFFRGGRNEPVRSIGAIVEQVLNGAGNLGLLCGVAYGEVAEAF